MQLTPLYHISHNCPELIHTLFSVAYAGCSESIVLNQFSFSFSLTCFQSRSVYGPHHLGDGYLCAGRGPVRLHRRLQFQDSGARYRRAGSSGFLETASPDEGAATTTATAHCAKAECKFNIIH